MLTLVLRWFGLHRGAPAEPFYDRFEAGRLNWIIDQQRYEPTRWI